jgi:sugar phosphate isomerase/epimerase
MRISRLWAAGIGGGIVMLLCIAVTSCQSEGKKDGTVSQFNPTLGVCSSLDNAEILKNAGFGYIEAGVRWYLVPTESDEKFAANFAAFKKSALPIYSCNGFLPGSLKSTGADAVHDEILDYAEVAFRRGQQSGIKIIVFGSGGSRSIPEGFDAGQGRKQFVSLLKRMGPIAQKYDVTVVIEPLNKKECNFINSVSEGADIARQVGHPNIKVLADFYHMMRENEGPESILKAGADLRHCHIAELNGRTPPGVNGDDFTGYFRALKTIGYKGRISIECGWKDLNEQAPKAIETLQEQLNHVNQVEDNSGV